MQYKCMRFKCVEGGRYRHRSSVLLGDRGRNRAGGGGRRRHGGRVDCTGGRLLGNSGVGDRLNRSSGVGDLGSSGVGDRGSSVLGRVGGILSLR